MNMTKKITPKKTTSPSTSVSNTTFNVPPKTDGILKKLDQAILQAKKSGRFLVTVSTLANFKILHQTFRIEFPDADVRRSLDACLLALKNSTKT
jgi:hypothetical protein